MTRKRSIRRKQRPFLTDCPGGICPSGKAATRSRATRGPSRRTRSPFFFRAHQTRRIGHGTWPSIRFWRSADRARRSRDHRQGASAQHRPCDPHTCRTCRRSSGVTITDANVHDILAAASVTVSVESATALKGMPHPVPAVLCGPSDLHHCAETAVAPERVMDALNRAQDRVFPFEGFRCWFLRQQMVNGGSDRLIETALAQVAARGATLAALGPMVR